MLELDFVFTNFEITILSALTSQIFIGFSCNIKLFFYYFCLSKPEHYYTMKKKLDGMNIIIQLKVQNHQNTCEATSTTILHGLSLQMLQKMLRPGRNSKHHILLSGNLILTNQTTLKNLFNIVLKNYVIILWCHIEHLMTWYKLPRRKCIFPYFQFVVLFSIALDN